MDTTKTLMTDPVLSIFTILFLLTLVFFGIKNIFKK